MVTSVPAPSTAIDPPSSTIGDLVHGKAEAGRATALPTTASASQGDHFSPQALNRKCNACRVPSGATTHDRPDVAHPRVVERQRDDFDAVVTAAPDVVAVAGRRDDRERLERARSRARSRRRRRARRRGRRRPTARSPPSQPSATPSACVRGDRSRPACARPEGEPRLQASVRPCRSPTTSAQLRARVSNWGRWGADDQRGTLNLITPEVARRGVAAVRSGDAFSLAIPFDQTGPQWDDVHMPDRINPELKTHTVNVAFTGDTARLHDQRRLVPDGLAGGDPLRRARRTSGTRASSGTTRRTQS